MQLVHYVAHKRLSEANTAAKGRHHAKIFPNILLGRACKKGAAKEGTYSSCRKADACFYSIQLDAIRFPFVSPAFCRALGAPPK